MHLPRWIKVTAENKERKSVRKMAKTSQVKVKKERRKRDIF